MSDVKIQTLVAGLIDHVDLPYQIDLILNGPGDITFQLYIHGKIYGQMPFDNLIKASVRLDPDHASGPERQILHLKKEMAEARGKMYEWQAAAMQLQNRITQLEKETAMHTSQDKQDD